MQATMAQLLHVSSKIASVWNDWASEINETRASRVACREAILGLVSNLVRLKSFDVIVIGVPTQRDTLDCNRISPIEASKSLDGAERSAESETKVTD